MVPRPPASLLIGIALAAALQSTPAGAAAFVWVDSDAGDYVGNGEVRRVPQMSAGDQLDVTGGPSWVMVDVRGSDQLLATLAGPGDAALQPGVYEGATRFGSPTQARLDVGMNGRGCNDSTGRLVVLEVARDAFGTLTAFSADLEQHCEGAAPALRVAVRWNAGASTCATAAPGTPCDDGDACTSGDACAGGACVGTSGPCGAGGECDPQVCQPHTGACVAVRGARACDDGDPCTEAGRCEAGACVDAPPTWCGPVCLGFRCEPGTGRCIGGAPPVCDDGNPCNGVETCELLEGCVAGTPLDCDDDDPCTDDACAPDGCEHVAVPDCWRLEGTAHLRIVSGPPGAYVRPARQPVGGALILHADGTWREPQGACPRDGTPFPDLVGRTRERRSGRTALVPTNLRAVARAARDCRKGAPRLTAARAWVRTGDGSEPPCRWAAPASTPLLCGVQDLLLEQVVQGHRIVVGARVRLVGRPGATSRDGSAAAALLPLVLPGAR